MSDRLDVRIITPERVIYKHEADSVIIPGSVGEMEILPGHSALFSGIKPGQMCIRDGAEKKIFACGAGMAEVQHDRVILLLDSAEGNFEIDPKAAAALVAEAEDKLKNLSSEDEEQRFAFETQLATAKAKIEVYERTTEGEHEASRGFSMVSVPAVEKPDTEEKK